MLGAIIGWQQNGSLPIRTRALYLDGTDVLLQPGTTTARYGVPIDTCEVTEQGPGGVSSLSFLLEDPSSVFTPYAGMEVRFHDIANDRPIFTGWIQAWTVVPLGINRAYQIVCVGIEAVLDWMIVPSASIAGFPTTVGYDWIEKVFAVALPVKGFYLNVTQKAGGEANDTNGDDVKGVGTLQHLSQVRNQAQIAVSVTGVTVREALRAFYDVAVETSTGNKISAAFTVDFYGRLRLYLQGQSPADYAAYTVTDTGASATVAEDPAHTVDGGGIYRGVYIVGGNAAGTGLVMDGTGIPGPIGTFSDSSIQDADALAIAGAGYLRQHGTQERGDLKLTDRAFTTNVRAGSLLTFTDAQLGVSGTYSISQIRRQFTGAREDWVMTYGALPPSFSRQLRRLTRTTLS